VNRRELKLTRNPDKTLLFETRELQQEDMDRIVSDIDEKVKKRLSGFEKFTALIVDGADPSRTLQERFGDADTEDG